MDIANAQPSSYRVEVSGWDQIESFFMETALLHWDGNNRHHLLIRARLRADSVIFLRLLQPISSDDNFPVPYVVSKLLSIEMDGRTNLLITRLHPKPAFKQTAEAAGNAVQVA